MKSIRLLFCAFFLLGGLTLQAAPVSQSRALDVAKRVFASQPATKAVGDVKLVWDGEDIATKSTVQPAFYVFGRDGGGFVIIAGDDNVTPVLAVSDRNEFKVEEMPDNVKWWMERMKAYVRATDVQTPAVREQWANLVSTKSGPLPIGEITNKVERLTPEWGQDKTYAGYERHVFNSKCPRDANNQYTLTGCVATALGELLTKLSAIYGFVGDGNEGKMLTSAVNGPVQPYSAETGFVPATVGGQPYVFTAVYDWQGLQTLMTSGDVYAAVTSGSKEALLDNMDQLLADLGAMVHAQYSKDLTTAVTRLAPDSMMKYMGINKQARYEYASTYSRSQWRQKLKDELYYHPILYSGRSKPEEGFPDGKYGHAFLFDGYGQCNGEDVFHVNFGWLGYCNGYYYETNLDADGTIDGNYSWQCGAVFGFYPNPASEYKAEISLMPGGPCPGMALNNAIVPGEPFKLNVGRVYNTGSAPFAGKVCLFLVNSLNQLRYNLVEWNFSGDPLPPNYYHNSVTFTATIPSEYVPTFGDRLILSYTLDNSHYLIVETPFNASYATMITEWPIMPVPFIATAASYKQNDYFEFKLKNHGCIFAGTEWTITDPDGVSVTRPQYDGVFQLTKTGTYKIQAAIAPLGGAVTENLVTYITVAP